MLCPAPTAAHSASRALYQRDTDLSDHHTQHSVLAPQGTAPRTAHPPQQKTQHNTEHTAVHQHASRTSTPEQPGAAAARSSRPI